jgi:hypothetical protein
VDFFSTEQIAYTVADALERQKDFQPLRARARGTVIERYDLKRVCLPAQLGLVTQLQEKLDRGQGGVGVQDVDALQANPQAVAGAHEGVPGGSGVAL